MMRTAKILSIFFIVLALCAGSLQAEDIEIKITAEVTYVNDHNLLEGKINVGDIITGSYIYDSDTPDSNPLTNVGSYRYYNSPYGIYLSAGGFKFQTDPYNVNCEIKIVDNSKYGLDFYYIMSKNNKSISNGSEEIYIPRIDWELEDYSKTAISSTALPTTPPFLEDWPDNLLRIEASIYPGGGCDWIILDAKVISVELVEPIEASVEIKPDTLNVQSKGRWISCRIRLPEPYEIADIEPNSVLLEDEIQPEHIRITGRLATLKFSRDELQDMLKQSGVTGLVQLKVSGELTDGSVFEGTDVIRVNNGGKK